MSGGPHRGLLPGVSPASVGHHRPLCGSRFGVSLDQVPPGGRYVRIYLYARGHDSGSLPSRVQPHGHAAEEESALERAGVRGLGGVARGRPAADLHLLARAGGSGSLRLLGAVRAAVGTSSLRYLDNVGHFRAAYPDCDGVPGVYLPSRARQSEHEDAPRELLHQQRARALQGSHKDRQDDRCDRSGLCGLLGAFFHRAAVVSVG